MNAADTCRTFKSASHSGHSPRRHQPGPTLALDRQALDFRCRHGLRQQAGRIGRKNRPAASRPAWPGFGRLYAGVASAPQPAPHRFRQCEEQRRAVLLLLPLMVERALIDGDDLLSLGIDNPHRHRAGREDRLSPGRVVAIARRPMAFPFYFNSGTVFSGSMSKGNAVVTLYLDSAKPFPRTALPSYHTTRDTLDRPPRRRIICQPARHLLTRARKSSGSNGL